MVDAGKIDNIRLNVELRKVKSPETIESDESMFSYELSAPVDSYSVQSIGSDWNATLTKEYKKLGLKSYTWAEMNGFDDAVLKSQNNFIDLIRMYEGHGSDFKAKTNYKDGLNVSTYGYGLTTTAMKAIGNYKNKKVVNAPTNQTQAYTQLLKYLNDVSLVETKRYLGDVKYDTLPSGIKAALLDYHFKSGYDVMSKSKLKTKLKTAMESDTATAWAAVLKELVYAKPSSSKAAKVDDPGIYRRSLSRVILAATDLKTKYSKDAATIDKAVKEVYENAVACSKANSNKGLNEIEKIYKAYKEKSPAGSKPVKNQNESGGRNQYVVPEPMGVYSAAGAIIPDSIPDGIDQKELRKKVINEIIKLNNIPTNGVDANGYPKVAMLEKGTQLIMPDTVTVGKSAKIRLKSPDDWNLVSGNVSENSEPARDDRNYEQIRTIDLLDRDCPKPTYSSIVSDKNLKCATYKYTVQKGDTIYSLAMRYGVDWKTLLADNNMTKTSILKIDDKIEINKIVYTVKKGDNLTQISKKYGLTVDYMRDINNLEDVNDLTIGQKLEIPGYVYTIKKGDNLTQIAKRAGVDVNELVKLNGLKSPDNIKEGDKLVILFNDADYNISDENKLTSRDDEGNDIVTIKSDNTALKKREYLTKTKNKKNGKYVASKHPFEPTKKGSLSGKTIIVNAGHGYKAGGGYDPGAPGAGSTPDEWLVNYDNSMRLIENLRARGAKVIYLQGHKPLVEAEFAKCGKVDLFISVHANSSGRTKDRTQIYYRDDLKNDHSYGEKSKNLAELAAEKFDKWIPKNEAIKQADKFYDNGKPDYAQAAVNDGRTKILKTAINQKHVPSILWEVAFISEKKGRERLGNSKLMDSYAAVMADVVEQYFKEEKASSAASSSAVTKKTSTNKNTYTVKSGDTLGSIAQKHGTTVTNLKKWNNLKSVKIVIGQVLIIKK